MMVAVNIKRFLIFVVLIFLAFLDVSLSDPRIENTELRTGYAMREGYGYLASKYVEVSIYEFNEIVPGKEYSGGVSFPTQEGEMTYAIGIGDEDKQFKLILLIPDGIKNEPNEEFKKNILDFVNVTVTPQKGYGKKNLFNCGIHEAKPHDSKILPSFPIRTSSI